MSTASEKKAALSTAEGSRGLLEKATLLDSSAPSLTPLGMMFAFHIHPILDLFRVSNNSA